VPPVQQLDDSAAGGGAGDQVKLVGLGNAVEQPGALARNVGEQAQLELVDQVEPEGGFRVRNQPLTWVELRGFETPDPLDANAACAARSPAGDYVIATRSTLGNSVIAHIMAA
jgi:hypothetical protein